MRDEQDFFSAMYPNQFYLTIVSDRSGRGVEYSLDLSYRSKEGSMLLEQKEIEDEKAEAWMQA